MMTLRQISFCLLLLALGAGGCSHSAGTRQREAIDRLYEVLASVDQRAKQARAGLAQLDAEHERISTIRRSSEAILLRGGSISGIPPPRLPAGFDSPIAYELWLEQARAEQTLEIEQANAVLGMINLRFAEYRQRMRANTQLLEDMRIR